MKQLRGQDRNTVKSVAFAFFVMIDNYCRILKSSSVRMNHCKLPSTKQKRTPLR